MEPERTIRMGNPPLRVEFQTTVTGVQIFGLLGVKSRRPKWMVFLSTSSAWKILWLNKEAAGRLKDLLDVKKLGDLSK